MIATGTPSGVGSATGSFPKPGDIVRATIAPIGTLENPVEAEIGRAISELAHRPFNQYHRTAGQGSFLRGLQRRDGSPRERRKERGCISEHRVALQREEHQRLER